LKVLVTGGAGYIGSHLVDALLKNGNEVFVVDNLSTGRIENIEHNLSKSDFRFVNDSILNEDRIDELIKECDTIFHLAAQVGVKHVLQDPLEGILTNVRGTEIILRFAHRHKKKVILASSSEVYGKASSIPFSEDDNLVLGPTNVARWSYAASKLIDEHLGFAYYKKGLSVVILRFFNSYGPRLDESGYGSVIARFIGQAINGEPITVHGDGRQTRCFTFIEDTVRGIILSAEKREAEGKIFNIGSDIETSIEGLAGLVKSITGSKSEIIHVPYESYYGQGFEDVRRRAPDVRKSADILRFRARVSLEEGLNRMIAWWKDSWRR
jgi:UDP-glucose 4-epimerase